MLTLILFLTITAAVVWAVHRGQFEAALRGASRALAHNMTSRDRAPRYVPRHRGGRRG